MKLKKLLYLSIFLLISCGNNTSSESTSSSQTSFTTSEEISNTTLLEENLSVITFFQKDNIEESINCSNDIEFKYDQDNSNNIKISNNNLELTNSSFAFSISKVITKIEICLINEPTKLYVGVINKYNVKAQYDLQKEEKLYYYSFAEYLSAKHIYIESKELTIIEKIIIYY